MATPSTPRSTPLRIFVSSTQEDLKEHRDIVTKVIHGLGQTPIYMEAFYADWRDSLRTCRDRAASADALVVIVGTRYGYVPETQDGEGKSMVWHEVEAAAKIGKHIFCYLSELPIPKEEQASLARFRRFLDDKVRPVYYKFSNPYELGMGVAIALSNWLWEQAQSYDTALRLLDFGSHPSPPKALWTAEFPSVPLIDKILSGFQPSSEELDNLLDGKQLRIARKDLAECIARAKEKASNFTEQLARLRKQERELSARIECLARERPPIVPLAPAFPQQPGLPEIKAAFPHLQEQRSQRLGAYEAALRRYQEETERYRAQLEDYYQRRANLPMDRSQLDRVRELAAQAELSLTQTRQEGERERRRREKEVFAARAKDLVLLLHEMESRGSEWLEDSRTLGHGFLLHLSTGLAISALNRHLASDTASAKWAAEIKKNLNEAADKAVHRSPQIVGRDSLLLAVALLEGMQEGERTTTEVQQILDGVPAEALQRFDLEQKKLLSVAPPRVEGGDDKLIDPKKIEKAIARVERDRADLADTLSAIRALQAEAADLQQVAKGASQQANEVLRRFSARVDSLRPRLEDCRRAWAILTRAAESTGLGDKVRSFCRSMKKEAKTRLLQETPEALVARCESQKFGLPQVRTICESHLVTAYLKRADDLRKRLPELEARSAELSRAGRKLAELPRRRTEEYRRGLRLSAFWAVLPWKGCIAASKGGGLIRHFMPLLYSDHPDCRGLSRWSLAWLVGAAMISALGTICFGLAVPPALTDASPIWAVMLALTALGYLLGLVLWTTQTVWLLGLKIKIARAEKQTAESQRFETR